MKEYDIMVVGPVSLDHNIDYLGNERKEVGGAVVASGFAAAGSGAKTAIFCKSNAADADVKERFAGVNADLYWAASKATCSIRNQYFTADKEKRACTSMGVCDPFRFEELPQVKTKVYHFAGLVYGDFDGALLAEAAKHGKVGLDVQCMLRHVEPDKSMAFHDWAEKKELLPLMDYFKTDAAEAEVLTGLTDRVEAAKMLHDWGAKEVVITHRGVGLCRQQGLHLPHQGPEPLRPYRSGRYHFRRIYRRASAGQRGGSAELLHRPRLPENGDPRPL